MRRALALLLCFAALAFPALFARAGGWFSPSAGNASSSAHTIYGTGGPMDGLWESALAGDYRLSCFHEDFDAASMPNATAFGGSLDPAWATSGWTPENVQRRQ